MHPRGEFTRHYVVPGLTARGYAVFGHNSRYLNNDTDMVHERLLFDIAAGMRYLKEPGFEQIVLLGNSGGGSLLGFYQSQAGRAPGERLTATPGGEANRPQPAKACPRATSTLRSRRISAKGASCSTSSTRRWSTKTTRSPRDAAWDMYNPANGYRPFPEPQLVRPGWLAGYRRRQLERNRAARRHARDYLATRRTSAAQMREPASLPAGRRARAVTRHARLGRYMVIYRTLANPAYLDPTIDPSKRPLGSIFSPGDPIIGNYGPGGLARVMTPRAWLSTWSGLSSQADLPDTIQHVTHPDAHRVRRWRLRHLPCASSRSCSKTVGRRRTSLSRPSVGEPLPLPRRSRRRGAGRPARPPDRLDRPWIEERISEP